LTLPRPPVKNANDSLTKFPTPTLPTIADKHYIDTDTQNLETRLATPVDKCTFTTYTGDWIRKLQNSQPIKMKSSTKSTPSFSKDKP
jgi:hypothetical protein